MTTFHLVEGVVEVAGGEGVDPGVVEVADDEEEVLVEEVEDEGGDARVVEVAVDEEGAAQELELGEGEVGGEGGAAALLAEDADAHVRLLDHRHVVGAVADRRCHWLRLARLDELDDLAAKEMIISFFLN